MPLEIDFQDFKYVILRCSECGNSIKVMIAKKGSNKVSDAIDKAGKEAKSRKWKRDPDICPKH